MLAPATLLLTINPTLRYVLYGVSILLDIELRASEIERLFAMSASGDSTANAFEFHRSPHALVTGHVDEHEPESVWLSVSGSKLDRATLERLVDAAKHASFGLLPRQTE